MTTAGRAYPTRVTCRFQGKDGQVVLDQIRTVDKTRLVKQLGRISSADPKEGASYPGRAICRVRAIAQIASHNGRIIQSISAFSL